MIKDKDNVKIDDVLQPGKKMVAAGYCMYGSSCMVNRTSQPITELTRNGFDDSFTRYS